MLVRYEQTITRFNTQPPEGGWACSLGMAAFSIMFQHTAARRRLGGFMPRLRAHASFQHTAARRRLGRCSAIDWARSLLRFNTQPPEGGWPNTQPPMTSAKRFQHTAARRRLVMIQISCFVIRLCFNTQPPEGGWEGCAFEAERAVGFNTQPPEGGWRKYRGGG